MKTSNNVGEKMRNARRRLGWTQLELSQRVGCTESLISKFETARASAEPSLRAAIARELGIATWEVGV